jgi:hypothetical protein
LSSSTKDPLAADFRGREPLLVPRRQRQHGRLHLPPLELVLTLEVRADGVEATEAHLDPHLSKFGHDHETPDAAGEVDAVSRHTVRRELHPCVRDNAGLLRRRRREGVVLIVTLAAAAGAGASA